jgi:hypothetical protein
VATLLPAASIELWRRDVGRRDKGAAEGARVSSCARKNGVGEEKGRRRRWCLVLYKCGGKVAEGGGAGSEGSHTGARRMGA